MKIGLKQIVYDSRLQDFQMPDMDSQSIENKQAFALCNLQISWMLVENNPVELPE